jgi:hypothetical protein
MSYECEVAGGVTRMNETHYVFVYHCLNNEGYQIGMSTATHPLGPWTKPPTTPTVANGKGLWDGTTVACFNILEDPDNKGQWLGFYAASGEPKYPAPIGLGVARSSSSPLGPWIKSDKNPVLAGDATADPKHCFINDTRCSGIYLASVLHGPHTNNSYWAYLAGPLNQNDEGAMALWTSEAPEGPWSFNSYILDGGLVSDKWDSGRYSESRVLYQDGVFHLFLSASATGGPKIPASQTSKHVEQLGWAVSDDGIHFTEYAHNPIAPHDGTTPLTAAMAEGHAIIDEKQSDIIYVHHTIRWEDDSTTDFAPYGRNGEDLGVEIFTASPSFSLEIPIITPHWKLTLRPGDLSPCLYDKNSYRFCANLKTVMDSSDPNTPSLEPEISFKVQATISGTKCAKASVVVQAFSKAGVVGKVLKILELRSTCTRGNYLGETASLTADELNDVDFIVAYIANAADSVALTDVTQLALYKS